MTLLELISKTLPNQELKGSSAVPISLNPDYSVLKPKEEAPDPASLVRPLTVLQLSEAELDISALAAPLYNHLRNSLNKSKKKLKAGEFISTWVDYMQRVKDRADIHIDVSEDDPRFRQVLIEKVGSFMGDELTGLVLEACVSFRLWYEVSSIIVNGFVPWSAYSNLVLNLIEERRSDLVCLCVKHASDLKLEVLCCVLKYFLCPPDDAYDSMRSVRVEWENQGAHSIKLLGDKKLKPKNESTAKDAAVLLMLAIDGFSESELCLHYLLVSSNIDDMTLSSAIRKLNGEELMSLISYLGKWVSKYERFPHAILCPYAGSLCKLGACDWVPKLEDVIGWIGLVVDENFTSLVLHQEFHEEMKGIERVVSSFAAEARICSSLVSIVDTLKYQEPSEVL